MSEGTRLELKSRDVEGSFVRKMVCVWCVGCSSDVVPSLLSNSWTRNKHSQLDVVLGTAALTLLIFDTERGKWKILWCPQLQEIHPRQGGDPGLSPHSPASLVRILLEGRLGSPIPRMLLARTRNS